MRPHIRLINHWLTTAIFITIALTNFNNKAILIISLILGCIFELHEKTWLTRVYQFAPTPQEFLEENKYWKTIGAAYGFFLAALAILMLAFNKILMDKIGENIAQFVILLAAPLFAYIVHHQVNVFNVLRTKEKI
jgi:hypothetical protein